MIRDFIEQAILGMVTQRLRYPVWVELRALEAKAKRLFASY
jgi:hypothetical protein